MSAATAVRPQVAFVLAAGFGQRMRPLTDDRPKPMVALGGRPLIDHVLDRLAAAGVTRAVVNVHYKAEVLERHLQRRSGMPAIEIADERARLLDTGGGVAAALQRLGPEPFYIHNSDTVWRETVSNLERLAAAWDPARMDGLLLLARAEHSIGYDGAGDFVLHGDGALARRPAGGRVPHVFAGVSIAHPRLFEGAPAGAFSLNLPWDRAIAAGRLHGVVLDGLWMHVGTPAALAEAEERMDDADRG